MAYFPAENREIGFGMLGPTVMDIRMCWKQPTYYLGTYNLFASRLSAAGIPDSVGQYCLALQRARLTVVVVENYSVTVRQ
jgi:hypothetical protein